jgi:hypothetical protein
MAVTIFGTCRINGITNNNNLNNIINYPHSTKEVIQQIKFLLGETSFPSPFDKLCFRTGIFMNKPILYDPSYHKLLCESTVCVIEICSSKTYVCDDFYLHHLCVDKRFSMWNKDTPQKILNTFQCRKQSYTEIENDILEIRKLLENKKIILVSHYNSKINGKYIESRNNLITCLTEICEKHNILFINPADVLKDYKQEDIVTEDLGHYTDLGNSKFSEYMNHVINKLL